MKHRQHVKGEATCSEVSYHRVASQLPGPHCGTCACRCTLLYDLQYIIDLEVAPPDNHAILYHTLPLPLDCHIITGRIGV